MSDKKERTLAALDVRGLDGLVCFLPENILFATGYWPSTAESALVVDGTGAATIVLPAIDRQFVPQAWDGEVLEYEIGADDIRAGRVGERFLEKVFAALDSVGSRVERPRLGYEGTFETVAGSFRGAEATVFGRSFFQELEAGRPNVDLVDASTMLSHLRTIKDASDIHGLRRANAIAAEALGAGKRFLRAGVTEAEVAAEIERTFQVAGISQLGARRARGYAFVMSGPEHAANAWLPANFSLERKLEEGDLVVIEFNAFADGYWVDLSRTFAVGEPSQKQRSVHAAVDGVRAAVINELRTGMAAETVDELARDLMREEGLLDNFLHYIGHGVGFAFHESPILGPGSEATLEPGMVLAIEPGAYVDGWGGVRIEDNIAIGPDGDIAILSDFDTSL